MTIIFVILGIWLFFWFIGNVAEEMGANRAASQISQNQQYRSNGQQSQVQGNTPNPIEALFPFIDVYSYYALDDNRSWTSAKVRYIKHILSDDLTTEWNRALLKERLKLSHQRSLNDLLHDLRCYLSRTFDHEKVTETKAVIMILCRMMDSDGVSKQRIKDKARYIASFLGLPATELAIIFNQLFPNAQQQQQSSSQQQRERSHQDSRNSSNSEQNNRNQNNSNQSQNKQNNGYQDSANKGSNSSSYNNKNSNNAAYEWACSVLGLEPDNVTPESVQKAYRSKIKEYHPDKHQNLPETIQRLLHEKTMEVNEARVMLLKLKD